GGEVADGGGDVFHRAATADGHQVPDLLVVHRDAATTHVGHAGAEGGVRVPPQVGEDRPRTHRVDGDAAGGIDHRHLTGEAHHPVLGRDVGGATARAVEAGHRGHVHDASSTTWEPLGKAARSCA